MWRLKAFFKRFRVFLIFLLLQSIALFSYFSVMSFPRTRFFNTSSAIVGTLLTWENEIVKYFYLDEANVRLQKEIVTIQHRLPINYIPIDEQTVVINDTLRELSFERIPATVINSPYSHANNYFTINAGTKKGIYRDMGVVSPKGAVGIVYDVSSHFSIVKSILTKDINISAYIDANNAFGLIKYEGKDPTLVQLTGISNDIPIKKGDLIRTRGSAGFFPQGIPIGKIISFKAREEMPMWDITVKLSQDMRKLRYVSVIKNIHKQELDSLENKVEQLR